MLWSEKTTVCRIFNCQRSAWGASPPNPHARSPAGPLSPRRSLAWSPLTATAEAKLLTSVRSVRCYKRLARRSHVTASNDATNGRRRPRDLPDVGVREAHSASFAHRNFFQRARLFTTPQNPNWLANRSSFSLDDGPPSPASALRRGRSA
jgi:hypothetical protein